MKNSFIIGIAFLFPSQSLFTQDKILVRNNQVWFGDFLKVKLNQHWSAYLDVGLRRTDWLSRWSQTLYRPGISYSVNEKLSFVIGVARFNHYVKEYIRPEWRGWEQLLYTQNFGRLKISHRFRAEQRFTRVVINDAVVGGYNYNNRFRYQLNFQIPLIRKSIENRTLFLAAADEIMFNTGKEIVYNHFDQNRASVGIGWKQNDYLTAIISYMNVFIKKNQKNSFENNNVMVLNLYHTFQLKKKTK